MRAWWRSRSRLERALLVGGAALLVGGPVVAAAAPRVAPSVGARAAVERAWLRARLASRLADVRPGPIVDPWGREALWGRMPPDRFPPAPPGPYADDDPWPAPAKLGGDEGYTAQQLWSRGPDGVDERGGGDDVVLLVNWNMGKSSVAGRARVEPAPAAAPLAWAAFHVLVVAPAAGPLLGLALLWLGAAPRRPRGGPAREAARAAGQAAVPLLLLLPALRVGAEALDACHDHRWLASLPRTPLLGPEDALLASAALVIVLAAAGVRAAARGLAPTGAAPPA